MFDMADTFVFTGKTRYTEKTPRKYTLSPVIKKSLWQIESVDGGVWDETAHAFGGPGDTYENNVSPVLLPLGPEAEDPRKVGSSYTYRGYIVSAYGTAPKQYTGNGSTGGMPDLNLYGALGEATLSYTDNSGNKVESDFPIRLSHPRPEDNCRRAWRHPLGAHGDRSVGCDGAFSDTHMSNIYIWGPDLSSEQKRHYCAITKNNSNKQIKQLVITTWPWWAKRWWNTTEGGSSLAGWDVDSLIPNSPVFGRLNEILADKLDNPNFIRTIGVKRPYAADMLQELFEVTVEVDSRTDPVCKTP